MKSYYREMLSAERLKQVYEIAPPRIERYLEEEINYVRQCLCPNDAVLELGCGYGRVLSRIAGKAKSVVGIDTSLSSLKLGKKLFSKIPNSSFVQMNAAALAFPDHTFDVVICIQNGISAFHMNQECLLRESIRAAKPGGIVLFSSYSSKFWAHRLEWFKMQSEAGLIGKIDYDKTKDGAIVCKDGFRATTVSEARFKELASKMNEIDVDIEEVDESCLFCKIRRRTAKGI